MKKNPDSIDRRILAELQSNGRLPIVELANRVHLTKTPTAERVKRLERTGVIKGYRADLEPELLGAGHVIIVHVSLTQTSDNALELFNRAVHRIPEIQSCYMLAGQFDYMLKVRTSDITHYRTVLGDQIGKLPGVQQTHSYVALEVVKENATIPVRA
ncbi:MAG: winged helix-turn-helix transcriptional regulator [Alphaproteobacteria bacterium]|nr:winged helix-turn-helix transcriptional regulator [Alphaproteobacteria bacterium]